LSLQLLWLLRRSWSLLFLENRDNGNEDLNEIQTSRKIARA
jgi:hypothetical protein